MKSVSVGKLKDLEKEGWKVSPQDKNAISAQVAVSKAAVAIALSLEHITEAINKVPVLLPGRDETEIATLLNNHYELTKQLLSQISDSPKTWEFELKRNNNGFLEKVIANGR